MNKIPEDKITIDQFIEKLEEEKILCSSLKTKGVTYTNSDLAVLIERFLQKSKNLFIEKGYTFMQLPVFVKGEDFLLQCKKIKDFSKRVFWGDPLKNNDLHVFNSTIEAQISSLLALNIKLAEKRRKFFFIRQIGRYESGKTMPFWKERLISFFVESQTLHLNTHDRDMVIDEMNHLLQEIYDLLLIHPFFIERFKENKRLSEYSERRLETVAMDPSGNFSILSSIYDLGDSFSKVFNVKINDIYPLMLNFAYSARLFLLMMINHADKVGILYPARLSESSTYIFSVGNNIENEKKLAKILKYKKLSFKIKHTDKNKWKSEFFKIKRKGIPVIFVLKESNNFIYKRINDKAINIKNIDEIEDMDLNVLLDNHDKLLKERQAEIIKRNIYFLNNSNLYDLENLNQNIIIAGLCGNPNCFSGAKDKMQKWDILGHLLKKDPKIDKCFICGNQSEYTVLLGKKVKTDK